MTDLYRVLGVRRNASHASIRAAYRTRAKTAHPDVGGDRAHFDQLKLAHDVLTDPKRRAHYDATGEAEPLKADNALAEVLTMLATAFDSVLNQIGKSGRNVIEFDIVASMRADLAGRLTQSQTNAAALERGVAQLNAIVGRFTTKRGENLLESVVRGKIAQAELVLKRTAHEQELVTEALALLDEYGFNYEVRQAVMVHIGGGSTTTASNWF